MKDKDTILLEQAYIKILLKEDPDNTIVPKTNHRLNWDDDDARAFGYVNIDKELKLYIKTPLVFKDFGPKWHNKFYIQYEDDQQETHGDLMKRIMKEVFKSPQGIIEGGIFDNVLPAKFSSYLGKAIDLSKNPFSPEDFFTLTKELIFKKLNSTINAREFLAPAGRIWIDANVVSFWARRREVTAEHLNALFEYVYIPMEQAYKFHIEFLGDISGPTQTVGEYLSNTKAPIYSKEEQEASDKKAAEDMAKAHEAAALGTKDKDVQKIIDDRKKAMSNRESELRTKGIIPSLQTRQQTMTSESYKK